MAQPLILHTDKKPTMFNKNMAIGLLLAPLPIAGVLPLLTVTTALIAGTIGGIIGKFRMKRELEEGKEVREPSAFNKSALIGGLIGGKIAGVINFGMMATAAEAISMPEVGAMTVAMIPAAVTAATSIASILLPALAIAVTAVAIGAFIGGRIGKKQQEKEYAEALQQQSEQKARVPSMGIGLEQEPSLSKSHAAEILKERARAQAQLKQL